jgi:hypothetical protein
MHVSTGDLQRLEDQQVNEKSYLASIQRIMTSLILIIAFLIKQKLTSRTAACTPGFFRD